MKLKNILVVASLAMIAAAIIPSGAFAATFQGNDKSYTDQYYVNWDGPTITDTPSATYHTTVTWDNTLKNIDSTVDYYYPKVDYSYTDGGHEITGSKIYYGGSRNIQGSVYASQYGQNSITSIMHKYQTEGGAAYGVGYLTHTFNC